MRALRRLETILVVEDADEDFETMTLVMREQGIQNPIFRCVDDDIAWRYLCREAPFTSQRAAPRPFLVLLDLNLGCADGRRLLRSIKASPELRHIVVIVLSTSSNPKDVKACYQAGANGYAVKPSGLDNIARLIAGIKLCWLDMMELPA